MMVTPPVMRRRVPHYVVHHPNVRFFPWSIRLRGTTILANSTILLLLLLHASRWSHTIRSVDAFFISSTTTTTKQWTVSLNAIRSRKVFKRKNVLERSPYNSNVDNDSDDDDDDDDFNVPIPRLNSNHDDESDDEFTSVPTTTKNIISKSHFFSQKSINDPSFRILPPPADRNNQATTADTDSIFQQLCRNANIDRPSKIQSMAWPILLKQQQQQRQQQSTAVVVADQTGSGKTLAYLIPLLQHMIHTKRTSPLNNNNNNDHNSSNPTTAATPKLLVLTPTSELADQIRNVCARLSGESNHNNNNDQTTTTTTGKASLFKTIVLTATGQYATNIRDQIRLLQLYKNNVDVIISTPGRIATILRTKQSSQKILDVQYLQAVVFDEVDVLLLDETFGPQLQTIGQATTPPPLLSSSSSSSSSLDLSMTTSTPSTQYVFVTATLPDSVLTQIKEQFTNTILVKGPGLHRVAPTVTEKLIDVSVPSSVNRNTDLCFEIKAQALQQALRQNRCQRTLIFCNTVSTCRQVENLLFRIDRRQQIYRVKAYHNAMTADARNEHLAYFARAGRESTGTGSRSSGSSRPKNTSMKMNGGTSKSNDRNDMSSSSSSPTSASYVLVCTDRAARGVDFHTAAVDHVILFDFPNDPAEYVRRVGRTARAGRTGASTVLAYGWQLPIARSIMGQQSSWSDEEDAGRAKGRDKASDDDADDEYMGGVQGRRKFSSSSSSKRSARKVSTSDEMIGSNIANGKLWNEKLQSSSNDEE